MSRLLKQLTQGKKAAPLPAEPLDHVSAAIKAAVMPEVAAQVREALQDLPAMVAQQVQQTATEQLSIQARKHAAGAYGELHGRLGRLEQAPGSAVQAVGDSYRAPAQQRPSEPMAPPAVPQAPRQMPVIEMQRDRAGKIVAAHVGGLTLLVERGADGRAQRLVPQEESRL